MGSPSAIDDILNNPRFQGAIDSISGVTAFCDSLFVAFISFVAFFIISAALLRNVIAGAYAAYPKLFDWVAEAKESGIQKMSGVSRIGPIAGFLLRLIPDFKNLSDFHDDTVEPKHYFMKSIPQMIGVVMIGVVIYNGYYRDAVSITAGFGSQIISRVLLTVDPIAVFDKIANQSGNPTFAHASDTSPEGKLITSLSTEIYTSVISFYTDINGEQAKSSLGKDIETWVTSQVKALPVEYLVEGSYSIQKQVTRVFGAPDVSQLGVDTDIVKTVGWPVKITDMSKFSSTKHVGEDWWLRVIVRFNKEAEKVPTAGFSNSVTMHVPPSYVTDTGGVVTIKLPSAASASIGKGGGTAPYVDQQSSSTVDLSVPNTITIQSYTAGGKLKSSTVSNLFYNYTGAHNSQIKNIIVNDTGTDITFTDDSGKIADFKWGDKPQEKAQSGIK
jgi:hypothetical protein